MVKGREGGFVRLLTRGQGLAGRFDLQFDIVPTFWQSRGGAEAVACPRCRSPLYNTDHSSRLPPCTGGGSAGGATCFATRQDRIATLLAVYLCTLCTSCCPCLLVSLALICSCTVGCLVQLWQRLYSQGMLASHATCTVQASSGSRVLGQGHGGDEVSRRRGQYRGPCSL